MRAWLFTLGGLLIWTVHFLGVYVIASLGDVAARAEDPAFRMAGLAFSLACLAAAGAMSWVAFRRTKKADAETPAFMDQLAAMGAALAMLAIAWQTLPTVVGY